MIYREFNDKKISLLGFGTMRLPTTENGKIDEVQTADMVKIAMEHGVNYFDTAYPYHGGESETVIGKILGNYPRESYLLATKFPGHQIADSYDPAAIFEEQLQKCGVKYFDFYLLHNVYENSIDVYMDPQWSIVEYFKEQKRLGRIKHLGFSTHGSLEVMETFLDYCGDDMDFCQIQLNYLDWTLQKGKEKYSMLTERGIPVMVMEPVRGGKLADLNEEDKDRLKKLDPDGSVASWAFRFLQSLPNVKVILSGMSNPDQVQDNLHTFSEENLLSDAETEVLMDIAKRMKSSVPCTGCKYCCDDCPQNLNIPLLLDVYNDLQFSMEVAVAMRLEGLPQNQQASACIGCGNCKKMCPQNIDIPEMLKDLDAKLEKIPKWTDICKQRNQEEK